MMKMKRQKAKWSAVLTSAAMLMINIPVSAEEQSPYIKIFLYLLIQDIRLNSISYISECLSVLHTIREEMDIQNLSSRR